MSRPSMIDRFWSKVDAGDDGCCWEWTAKRVNGYGFFRSGRRSEPAHRVAWMLAHSQPLPPGMEIDHLCVNRSCVNPAHLEPVTHRENLRRGKARRTTCSNGHPWTPENTLIVRGGDRQCRACNYERCRERRGSTRTHLGRDVVAQIRARLAAGEQGKALAAEYGVSAAAISRIRSGKTWPGIEAAA